MYVPRHFATDDPATILTLVRSAGFGHLVVSGPDGLDAVPLPFLVDDDVRSVRAHVARANPVWRVAPCDALLVVPVRDAYVSPGWYPSKQEHGEVVPTWNYDVVHLHGRLVAHDDPTWTGRLVRELTDVNEATLDHPWSVDDAPPEYIEKMQRAIVGLELLVTQVVAKRKMSQNRAIADIEGVTIGLSDGPPRSADVARAMRSM